MAFGMKSEISAIIVSVTVKCKFTLFGRKPALTELNPGNKIKTDEL